MFLPKKVRHDQCERAYPVNFHRTYGHITVLFASKRLQVLFSLPRKFYESLSGFVLFLLRKSFGGKSKNDFLLYLLITLPVYFSKNPGERKDTRVLPYGCAVFGMAIAAPFSFGLAITARNGRTWKPSPTGALFLTWQLPHVSRLVCKKPQRRRAEVGTPYIFLLDFWGGLLYNGSTDVENAIVAPYL